jgi:hypothetical protein
MLRKLFGIHIPKRARRVARPTEGDGHAYCGVFDPQWGVIKAVYRFDCPEEAVAFCYRAPFRGRIDPEDAAFALPAKPEWFRGSMQGNCYSQIAFLCANAKAVA